MAFSQIANSAGMLNHGGQMAWASVSDTRLVMVTFTADYKALVQEVNFANGATTIGPASFVKTIVGAGPTSHMRPKIRSLGNNRIFVMVPSAFVGLSQINPARTQGQSRLNLAQNQQNTQVPSKYDAFIMERDANGYYSVKSTINLDFTHYIANSTAFVQNVATYSAPFQIWSVSDTEIVIKRSATRSSASGNTTGNVFQVWTIPVADGIMGASVISKQIGTVDLADNFRIADFRPRRLPDKTSVMAFTISTGAIAAYTLMQGISLDPLTSYNTVFDSTWSLKTGVTTRGWLPITADGSKSVGVGYCGTYTDTDMTVNGVLTNAGQRFVYPLDTAWVTNTVMAIIGVPDSVVPAATQAATATGGTMFDIDTAVAIAKGDRGDIYPLYISLRDIGNAGAYVGPFDPINTGLFYGSYMNADSMIHRIDDSHFWIIGCFMESATADPKLGVITVGIPA